MDNTVNLKMNLVKTLEQIGDANHGIIKLGVHGSVMHADDLLCVAILEEALPAYHISVTRSRDPKALDKCDIVADVACPGHPLVFDHHEASNPHYPNGVPYAACGKLLEAVEPCMGLRNQLLWAGLYAVQLQDNGCPMTMLPKGAQYNPFSFLPVFNPTWEEGNKTEGQMLEAFYESLDVVRVIYRRMRAHAKAKLNSQELLPKCPRHLGGSIIELPSGGVPWLQYANQNPEIIAALYQDSSGSAWTVRVAKASMTVGDFVNRVDFPSEWGGLSDEALQSVSHIKGAVFCHRSLFLATFQSKEGALHACRILREKYRLETGTSFSIQI